MPGTIKIGTRGSQLALWQANWVKSSLNQIQPSLSIDLEVIKTTGDKILDVPLAKVGGKGLFVKEIEAALLEKRIDLAVHSMKDMPADLPQGLVIGPVPKRENPADVLISKNGKRFQDLPDNAQIGTSSLRRAAQILHVRPDIEILPLRGNLDTRLRKLETETLDAIVLAAAGVKRLGLEHRISQFLDPAVVLPAVGQGALCIEVRRDDEALHRQLAVLDHHQTRCVVLGERAFLKRLEGGCQVPIAAHGRINDDIFYLEGLVADLDGSRLIRQSISGAPDQSETIGIELAERLLASGADRILEKLQANA